MGLPLLLRARVHRGGVGGGDSLGLVLIEGLWRWVGLLVEALLLVGSEVVERGPLTVSVRSPSGRTGNTRPSPSDTSWGPQAPKACLISGGGRRFFPEHSDGVARFRSGSLPLAGHSIVLKEQLGGATITTPSGSPHPAELSTIWPSLSQRASRLKADSRFKPCGGGDLDGSEDGPHTSQACVRLH